MEEDYDLELRKINSTFRKNARIKECFHYDKKSCKGGIINAHSIQRRKVLTLIEEEVNGNNKLYSFGKHKTTNQGIIVGFDLLGKNESSTFCGFCKYHDTETFKFIENNHIDLENDEHCFLLSYRALAKDYHAKQEVLQGLQTDGLYQKDELIGHTKKWIYDSELGLRDLGIVKDRLNELLNDRKFDGLEYLTITLNYIIPIALSGSFNPSCTYKNEYLNNSGSDDPNLIYQFVNFVIQPSETGETHILLSCLPEHKKSKKIIDEIYKLKDNSLLKAISSLAITYMENTFFSLSFWQNLTDIEKKQLLEELQKTNKFRFKKFFHSKLNLFEKRFEKKIQRNY